MPTLPAPAAAPQRTASWPARFVASVESAAHPIEKQAIVDASAADAVLTGVFDVGWPNAAHRVLRNSIDGDVEALCQ